MADTKKTIYVYEAWSGDAPAKLGCLYVDYSKGNEHCSFEYDENWLKSGSAYTLDPDIPPYRGRHYPVNKDMFGLFADSSPDRWGRVLMQRRERLLADKEGRKPRRLTNSDFLLGVYDKTRMGALRFKLDEGGPFLSDDGDNAVPPWATLRALEEASRRFEQDENGLEEKWLDQLLQPGSSLGGARPKATIQDPKGGLWIAKFPSRKDEYDVGAWEKVVHDLAGLCGLHVPESRLETFSHLGSTFLVRRFDRDGDRRIHFASAMTMLGKTDGDAAQNGVGYLDLVSFLRANGASPTEDLIELWKRVVFNMAVSNTDDHLRNHGFILSSKGWRLSPLYDVNPVPWGDTLALNVNEEDNSISVDLAIETAGYYGVSIADARKMANEITSIVGGNWERLAAKYGLSRGAIEYMRPAFSACSYGN